MTEIFEKGDVVRLINSPSMAAKVGALARVIEPQKRGSQWMRVAWIRSGRANKVNGQFDGSYEPRLFERVVRKGKTYTKAAPRTSTPVKNDIADTISKIETKIGKSDRIDVILGKASGKPTLTTDERLDRIEKTIAGLVGLITISAVMSEIETLSARG
jgi:hypothetical protein